MASAVPIVVDGAVAPPHAGTGARRLLVAAAAVRVVLAVVAVPLAPLLYRDHPLALVLLRPTKEILLFAGFLVRRGSMSVVEVYAAAVPLAVLGVWISYGLGRAFSADLHDESSELPGIAGRLLPKERIARLCRVLDQRGTKVVVLGRLAAFPSSLLAAAAGASTMSPRRFLVADGVGAVLAVTEVVVAGYVLGEAYERAGVWVTAAGVAVAAALVVLLGRWLRRGPAEDQPAPGA